MYKFTPFKPEGLTKYDHLPPEEALAKAWNDPGVNPAWHHRMQQIVRSQMPVLARALDRLVETKK